MNSEKFDSWRPNERKLRHIRDFETHRPKRKFRLRDAKSPEIETLRPIKNTSEVSRSCQNFPRPAFFKVPFYNPISIQGNLLVLETVPPVGLGPFLSFLKEKRWNKYNQQHKSSVSSNLPHFSPKERLLTLEQHSLSVFLRLGVTVCGQKWQIPAQCHEQAHKKAWVLSWGICTHLTWRLTEQV